MNNFLVIFNTLLLIIRTSFCYDIVLDNYTIGIDYNSSSNSILSPILNASTSDRLTYALLSERIVTSQNRFTKVPEILVNISSVINSSQNLPRNETFVLLQNIIKAGVTGFAVDLEYNEAENQWVVYNQDSFMTFDFILEILSNFTVSRVHLSNLRIMHVLLNIVNKDEVVNLVDKLKLINFSIQNNVWYERLLTMQVVEKYDGWPTTEQIVLYEYKQFVFHYMNVETDSTQSVMSGTYIDIIDDASQNLNCPLQIVNSSRILTYRNSESFTPQKINEAIYCGYKVIISNPFEKFDETLKTLNSSLVWGWGENQPVYGAINFGEYEGFSSSFGGGYYMGCAILNTTNVFDMENTTSATSLKDYLWWNVANCFESKHALCSYPGDSDQWFISNNETDYFGLRSNMRENADAIGCPPGTYFTLPKTPQEMLSAYSFIKQLRNETLIDVIKENGIWIGLNSVNLPTCWVVGDYKTKCPYEQFINTRNFLRMVLPLVISGGCLMAAIFLLKFRRLPVQNDNKQWKKFIKDFSSKSDPDGVPY